VKKPNIRIQGGEHHRTFSLDEESSGIPRAAEGNHAKQYLIIISPAMFRGAAVVLFRDWFTDGSR
jgi:hypothetical protein